MCERVVIIDKGRILAEDTTDRLSERIQGAANVRVRASGPHPDILSALRALKAVDQVIEHDEESDGPEGAVFTVRSSNHDIAREIAQTIIHNGWALRELRPVTLDLEALFVRLTREEQKEAA